MIKRSLQVFGAVLVFGASAAITSTAVARNGSAQSSDFGFDPSQNSGPQDRGFSIGDRRQDGFSSDNTSNFGSDNNSDSASSSVPDKFLKRIVDGQVVLFRFSYRDGRWIMSGRKVLGNAPTTSTSTSTPSTSASDSRHHHRSFFHELKDGVERDLRRGGKQIVRDGFDSVEDRLSNN